MLCNEDLKRFSKETETQPSFVRFAAELYNYPATQHVKPVYRTNMLNNFLLNKSLDLSNADLSESDFTAANFRDYTLQACNLVKCVSLFTNFEEEQGSVVRKPDSAIHWIAIFSTFVKFLRSIVGFRSVVSQLFG